MNTLKLYYKSIMNITKKIALKINRVLPLYFPADRRFTPKLHLAIWNCGYCSDHRKLWQTLRDIRITIRKDCNPIIVIKKGHV